ncbi:MAG: alpha/beta fold hydrolase [Candidatus Thorarchaeota archaeon]|jgi:triacylglycerol esterase/lipase EstA (alpha/beta hydrolase family)
MMKRNRLFLIAFVLLFTTPLFMGYVGYEVKEPTVWIVGPEQFDESAMVAIDTIMQEIPDARSVVHTTTLGHLDAVPLQTDVLIIVGHGGPDGIESTEGVIGWDVLYSCISDLLPQKTVVLACNSPTDLDASIFGFPGQIDAEAGALLTVWQTMMKISPDSSPNIPVDRVLQAQTEMKNPLASAVYFVHGYFGSDSEWFDLMPYLNLGVYNIVEFFDYFAKYSGMTENEVHWLIENPISTYANDLADEVIARLPDNTQVDFVGHSMGGIIIREMIRLRADDLKAAKIGIGSVFTLASPHMGTEMAEINLVGNALAFISLLYGDLWYSPALFAMQPDSPFMISLNNDPDSYGSDINWHALATIDLLWTFLVYYIHNDHSDGLVAVSSAQPSFPGWHHSDVDSVGHVGIINTLNTINYLNQWLTGPADFDNDGLLDALELWVYNTKFWDWDSDNDGLSDGAEALTYGTEPLLFDTDSDGLSDGDEVLIYGSDPLLTDPDGDSLSDYDEVIIYGTNPNAWSSDGDILSDAQEIAWGYDPNDAYDPINAAALIFKAGRPSDVTGYVQVNHYTAMDYVKVYVKYKTSSGYWTSYFHVGTDYTPYYYGFYYVTWSLLQGYVQMRVKVQAYDSANHYLGSDYQYVTLPGGGGGGGKPPPLPY